MRSLGFLFLAVSVTLIVLGCTQSSPETKSKMEDAKKKVSDAVDATAAAAKAKRDDYVREMHKRLEEMDAKYDELKGRAAKADEQAKKNLQRKLDQAKVKRDAAATRLEELKAASHDRWEKIKDGLGNAFDDLKKAFD